MRAIFVMIAGLFFSTGAWAKHTIYHCSFALFSASGEQISTGDATLDIDDTFVETVDVSGNNLLSGLPSHVTDANDDEIRWFVDDGPSPLYLCSYHFNARVGGCTKLMAGPSFVFPAFEDCSKNQKSYGLQR